MGSVIAIVMHIIQFAIKTNVQLRVLGVMSWANGIYPPCIRLHLTTPLATRLAARHTARSTTLAYLSIHYQHTTHTNALK